MKAGMAEGRKCVGGSRAWDKERATGAGWPVLSTFREGTETPPSWGPPQTHSRLEVSNFKFSDVRRGPIPCRGEGPPRTCSGSST